MRQNKHICPTLQLRHNGHDDVSNHQPHDCLFNRIFRRRSKNTCTSKLRVTGLCAGNSPVTGEFPAPMVSNAENVSIRWRHDASTKLNPFTSRNGHPNKTAFNRSTLIPIWKPDIWRALYSLLWWIWIKRDFFCQYTFYLRNFTSQKLLRILHPFSLHDHQMETFPRYWPFVRGIHRSTVNAPHKDQWRRALMFILICTWINGWVDNREAGDLGRHRAHFDVTVMGIWTVRDHHS